jgi:hypothetical protein
VDRFQAIIKVRVTDELTGAAPNSRTTLDVKERGFFPRLGSDGLGGLWWRGFCGTAGRDYPVHLTIDAADTSAAIIRRMFLRISASPPHLRLRRSISHCTANRSSLPGEPRA